MLLKVFCLLSFTNINNISNNNDNDNYLLNIMIIIKICTCIINKIFLLINKT